MVTTETHRKRVKAIRVACIEEGETLANLARLIGCSRSFLSNLIAGRTSSARAEDLIANRFPGIIKKFPFRSPPTKVARKGKHGNRTGVQDSKRGKGGGSTRKRGSKAKQGGSTKRRKAS